MNQIKHNAFFRDKSVLVVDDCRMIFTATRTMFVNQGCQDHHIYHATDAKRCLELCRQHQFDFIICDYNLGKGTDGLQLLEILHEQQLISSRTVVFVVTADSARSVFYSFSEFEPDGYLIKPVRIHQVANRLIKAFKQKAACQQILTTYHKAGLSAAISYAQRYMQTPAISMMQAELYIMEKQYAQAKEALLALIKQNDNKARLLLAKLLLQQQAYTTAISFLKKSLEQPEIRIQVLSLLGEAYLRQGDLNQAGESFASASALSPENIRRLKTQFHIYELSGQHQARQQLAGKLSARAINSQWESFFTFSSPLRALLGPCLKAHQSPPEAATKSRMQKELHKIEKKYSSGRYRLHKQVLTAQYLLVSGETLKGQGLVSEISEALPQQEQDYPEEYTLSFYSELTRLYLFAGYTERASETLAKCYPRVEDIDYLSYSQKLILNALRDQLAEQKNNLTRLVREGTAAAEQGQNMHASQLFLEAWHLQPFDKQTSLCLLKALTRAIPMEPGVHALSQTLSKLHQTLHFHNQQTPLPDWYKETLRTVRRSFSALENKA